MSKRLREIEARRIIEEEVQRVGGGYEASLVRTDFPRVEANEIDWWYSGKVEEEGTITRRSVAYLRAYSKIGGAMGLQAQGLLLDRGRLHMDKYVIRRLHKECHLTFVKGPTSFFELTPSGRKLIEDGLPD